MKLAAIAFDENKARNIVLSCQGRIDLEPQDTANRLQLAWCFITWAIYQLGKKDVDKISEKSLEKNNSKESIDIMMYDGIRQAIIVLELSVDSFELHECRILLNIVNIFCNNEFIRSVYKENDVFLSEIIYKIRNSVD